MAITVHVGKCFFSVCVNIPTLQLSSHHTFVSLSLLSYHILFLSFSSFPPLSLFPSFHDLSNSYTNNGDDMNYEVYGAPVVDGVAGLQENKSHAHAVVSPHLEEPVDPVEDVLALRPQTGSDGSLHGRFCCDTQWDGEKREVVTSMEAMPVSAD